MNPDPEELANRIAREMYDEECLREVLASHGCLPVSAPMAKRLGSLGWAPAGYVAERLSPGPGIGRQPGCILCSPCVDHCMARPELLAATVASDLVHAAAAAWVFRVPLVGYIPVGQEIHLAPSGEPDADGWRSVAARVGELFNKLRLPPGSRLASTADIDVWKALKGSVLRRRDALPTPSLNGLYHLTDGSFYPAGTPFQFYYDHYRMNVAQYDRAVVETVFEVFDPLVVENLQQAKAIFLADETTCAPRTTSALLTVPAPGRSIGTRATRSAPDASYLLNDFLDGGAVFENAHVGQYWSTVSTAWGQLTR